MKVCEHGINENLSCNTCRDAALALRDARWAADRERGR